MKNSLCVNDDQRWQSVLERDSEADGQFVFAVQTTGIFCRPSCTAKHALRKNVRFFPDAQAALLAGFRPCKRCQPDKANARQHRLDKITLACQLLEQESPITLDALAEQVAMMIDTLEYAKRSAVNFGVPSDGLLKSSDQIQAETQQNQQMALLQQATPQLAKGISDYVNSGNAQQGQVQ